MKFYLSIFYFFTVSFLLSQNHSDWYSKMMIRNILYELSDDKYQGRQAGEIGGKKAGEYILNYLKTMIMFIFILKNLSFLFHQTLI